MTTIHLMLAVVSVVFKIQSLVLFFWLSELSLNVSFGLFQTQQRNAFN